MKINQQHAEAKGGFCILPGRILITSTLSLMTAVIQGACSPIAIKLDSAAAAPRKSPISAADDTNPVIFIHGTMGSRLVDVESGRVVWGDFSRRAANDIYPEALRGVSLPMERGRSLEQLKDTTKAVGYLDAVNVSVFGVLKVTAPIYGDTAGRFGDIISADGGQDVPAYGRRLDFHFDWRRSYDENARLFAAFIREKKRELVEDHGFAPDMKFNVVAHSQGALMFKYFLRYGDGRLPEDGTLPELTWAGAEYVEKIAYIGIPNGGVVPTLDFLTNGHKADSFMPKYEAAVVGTMPAIYQMLPRADSGALIEPKTKRMLDPLDYDLWVRMEWGLANPEQDEMLKVLLPEVSSKQERRAIALDHLRKCLTKAKHVQAALDRPCTPPGHIDTVYCVGNTVETDAGFLANRRHVKLARTEWGDGTVTACNALRGTGVKRESYFFKGDHLRIVTAMDVNQRIAGIFSDHKRSKPAAPSGWSDAALASYP